MGVGYGPTLRLPPYPDTNSVPGQGGSDFLRSICQLTKAHLAENSGVGM